MRKLAAGAAALVATASLLLAPLPGGALAAAAPAGKATPPCHDIKKGTPVPGSTAAVQVALADVTLVNQDGKPLGFVRDVVGDRIVVMDFVYTTCTTVCPVLSAIMTKVQGKLLGQLDAKAVHLVSITVDPTRDTPERLKAFSRKQRAGGDWTWLTGKKQDVDSVLRGLGAYTPDFVNHVPQVLVGDGRTGRWVRLTGFPSPEAVVAKVNELLAARTPSAASPQP